ncbi:MAG: polymer-forming cytoskeletal protein [Oscillospiraceae bacterium]|nr:polymer-forming cytoskeletal protein [Oscillospiraceae bacterium]
MGIKDNFSQAVKELWKKDSEKPDNSSQPAKPTELDKYLRQDQGASDPENEKPVIDETPVSAAGMSANFAQNNPANSGQGIQNAQNTQGFQRPLEVPYYPQDPPSGESASAQNSQTNNQNNIQGGYNDADTSSINRNVQNIQNNFGQNNANSTAQGAYSQGNAGGYNQGSGRPASANFGQGGGNGFVPPVQNPTPMQESNETEEITVISKNTSIDGNIRSLANMQIDGNIKGNVETTKNVDLSGKIIGDITCNNAGMNSAAMQGNISLKGRMRMDRDTILIGDLSSQYADINGRIRGKLDVAGKAELKRDAIVFGDINASTIAVTDGAIIQGYVNTTFLSKEDSRNVFPDAISIDSKE